MPARDLALALPVILALSGCTTQPEEPGQDATRAAPQNYEVLLENDHVRVLDFHARPGEKTPAHAHPTGYLVYDLSGGAMKFTSPDGRTTTDENRKPGDVSWEEPKTHASENVGGSDAHALIVEVKHAR